jgi:hypothetical protein
MSALPNATVASGVWLSAMRKRPKAKADGRAQYYDSRVIRVALEGLTHPRAVYEQLRCGAHGAEVAILRSEESELCPLSIPAQHHQL